MINYLIIDKNRSRLDEDSNKNKIRQNKLLILLSIKIAIDLENNSA